MPLLSEKLNGKYSIFEKPKLLLDLVSGCYCAFSFRKLKLSKKCAEIYSNILDSSKNLSFYKNNFDETSLNLWSDKLNNEVVDENTVPTLAVNNGNEVYLKTWYDQANNYHLSQESVNKMWNLIRYNDDYFRCGYKRIIGAAPISESCLNESNYKNNIINIENVFTLYLVISNVNNGDIHDYQYILDNYDGNENRQSLRLDSYKLQLYSGSSWQTIAILEPWKSYILSIVFNASNSKIRINNNTWTQVQNSPGNNIGINGLTIGSRYNSYNENWYPIIKHPILDESFISEMLFFDGDMSLKQEDSIILNNIINGYDFRQFIGSKNKYDKRNMEYSGPILKIRDNNGNIKNIYSRNGIEKYCNNNGANGFAAVIYDQNNLDNHIFNNIVKSQKKIYDFNLKRIVE